MLLSLYHHVMGYDADEPLVTVATFRTAVEGHMAKGCLEAAGIRALLAGEQMTMPCHWIIPRGGVQLQVREQDAAAAQEALASPAEPEA